MGLIYQFFAAWIISFLKEETKLHIKHKIIRNSTLRSTTTHFFGKSDKMYKRRKL